MKVINFYGQPSAGKSTHAATLFAQMKKLGYNCELVTEYAKDCVWRRAQNILTDQIYVFAKQHNRIYRLIDQVDYVITDSPILMCTVYGQGMHQSFVDLVEDCYHEYDNVNFFVNRTKDYNPVGRNQTEQESDEIGIEIKQMLDNIDIPYIDIDSDTDVECIMKHITPVVKDY